MIGSKLLRHIDVLVRNRCIVVHHRLASMAATTHKLQIEDKSVWKAAEKVVGYPTSFLNLRWLLNDEIANVAMHLKKLIGTNHPIMDLAKGVLWKSEMLDWGLIVLLVSKAGGCKEKLQVQSKYDQTAGILHNQRILAEVTEMIRTAVIIHKGLLNMDSSSSPRNKSDLEYGNKVALLCGDYLMCKAFADTAEFKNQYVKELIAISLRDMSENEFLSPSDRQNRPLPAPPSTKTNSTYRMFDDENSLDLGPYPTDEILGRSRDEWFLRHLLGSAKLLGLSCRCALILAGYEDDFNLFGYLFGKHLALALQAKLDYDSFKAKNFSSTTLISAPVMLHLANDPTLYDMIRVGYDDYRNCDFEAIWEIVSEGPAMVETIAMQYELKERALANLQPFQESDAKNALKNIINSI